MLVVTALLVYLLIAGVILVVFSGVTRRNKLIDRMLGPTMKARSSRCRRERAVADVHSEKQEFIDTR